MKCHLHSQGFTLVELVTTLVIIGVLGSMAVSKIFDDQVIEQRSYIDELASALRHARKIAIASECPVRFTLDPTSYTANQPDAYCNTSGAWTTLVSRGDGTPLQGVAPTDVLTAPATVIDFQPDGTIAVAPPNIAAGPFTITLDPESGMATVAP
jgi:prepilin-type N-terminal cleavage/methylation domain-containing protein